MLRFAGIALCLVLSLSFFGCAGITAPEFEPPTVGVSSFRIVSGEGAAPRFEIGLHIVNPNRSPLSLEGIVYTVILEGQKVLTGASGDLPVIAPYGEGDITLTATADLLNSIRLLTRLMKEPQEVFGYELEAQLDIGGSRPRIRVKEKGEFSFQGSSSSYP